MAKVPTIGYCNQHDPFYSFGFPSVLTFVSLCRFSKLFYAPEIMTVAASTSETPMVQMSLKLTEEREAKAMRNASKSKETWCLLLSSKCKMLFEILKNLFIS